MRSTIVASHKRGQANPRPGRVVIRTEFAVIRTCLPSCQMLQILEPRANGKRLCSRLPISMASGCVSHMQLQGRTNGWSCYCLHESIRLRSISLGLHFQTFPGLLGCAECEHLFLGTESGSIGPGPSPFYQMPLCLSSLQVLGCSRKKPGI